MGWKPRGHCRALISALRPRSSSIMSSCRVMTAQWIGWFDRRSPGARALARYQPPSAPSRGHARESPRPTVALRRRVVKTGELLFPEASASRCSRAARERYRRGRPERQPDRIHPAIQQIRRSLDLVFPHGKVERCTVCIPAPHQRRVFLKKCFDCVHVATHRAQNIRQTWSPVPVDQTSGSSFSSSG